MVSPMRRVEIIGNGGGGKSTLAIRLSRDFDLPYHSVDPIQWQPGWVRAPGGGSRLACRRATARSLDYRRLG